MPRPSNDLTDGSLTNRSYDFLKHVAGRGELDIGSTYAVRLQTLRPHSRTTLAVGTVKREPIDPRDPLQVRLSWPAAGLSLWREGSEMVKKRAPFEPPRKMPKARMPKFLGKTRPLAEVMKICKFLLSFVR